jgi:homoserine O-succinyltransferase
LPLHRGGGIPLTVGLVNNMPDGALKSTEGQFRRLLAAAAAAPVRLRLFYLPEVPRRASGRAYVEQHYEEAGALWGSRLDGLIVTGTEPRAADLRNEPYWSVLTRLVDWAGQHTISAVWSCLAAHAAVLHSDEITRQALSEKLSGLFRCGRIGDHAIVCGLPRRWRVPHSRRNSLSAAALTAHGYRLLSYSSETGPDMFMRQGRSLFVFFQGHPEYDADMLAREYRRDVGRFLAGERDEYPELPCSYFDEEAIATLTALRMRALRERSLDLLASYPAVAPGQAAGSCARIAVAIYRRWLAVIAAAKRRERSVETLHSDIAATC